MIVFGVAMIVFGDDHFRESFSSHRPFSLYGPYDHLNYTIKGITISTIITIIITILITISTNTHLLPQNYAQNIDQPAIPLRVFSFVFFTASFSPSSPLSLYRQPLKLDAMISIDET